MKALPMILRFASGSSIPARRLQEDVCSVDHDQRNVEVAAEQRDDLCGLARPEQAGVDEHAGELVADRLMQQQGGDRGIDAPGQAADHPAAAHLVADAHGCRLPERGHRPVAMAAGDPAREVLEQGLAARRVHDFGMELHAVDAPGVVGDRGERRGVRRRDHAKPGRQSYDLVAVAHPHLLARAGLEHAFEQRAVPLHVDEGAAELAVMADLDLAAELGADGLLAVADAEDRNFQLEHRGGRARRLGLGGRGRPAGENDRLRRERPDRGGIGGARQDLRIHAGLAHPPRDQLGELGAEVEDQDALGHASPADGKRIEARTLTPAPAASRRALCSPPACPPRSGPRRSRASARQKATARNLRAALA